jgi:hypothetical protein
MIVPTFKFEQFGFNLIKKLWIETGCRVLVAEGIFGGETCLVQISNQ